MSRTPATPCSQCGSYTCYGPKCRLEPSGIRSIEIVSAGVDPTHQIRYCDHCHKIFTSDDEAIETCTSYYPLTLCLNCYAKAGNDVR